ncbi:MAG TPA: hypothetical protein VGF67_32115 [Ktedonobacteraceae bacterium]
MDRGRRAARLQELSPTWTMAFFYRPAIALDTFLSSPHVAHRAQRQGR